VADPELRGGRHTKSRASLSGTKGKRVQTSKSVGSKASADALEAGLNPVGTDMPAEALSSLADERMKKARVERG
jgi:hypothetical protein